MQKIETKGLSDYAGKVGMLNNINTPALLLAFEGNTEFDFNKEKVTYYDKGSTPFSYELYET